MPLDVINFISSTVKIKQGQYECITYNYMEKFEYVGKTIVLVPTYANKYWHCSEQLFQ